jgi:hypothetical protein
MFPLWFAFAFLGGSFVFLDLGASILFFVFPHPHPLFLGALISLWLVGFHCHSITLNRYGILCMRVISPGQKWWPTLLGSEISCSQWEGPNMHSRCLTFFPFMFWGVGVGGGGRVFNFFPWFLMCSRYVHSKFPMGSPTCSP